MRLLLDTHAFLWAATEPSMLSERARAAIEASDNEILLSTASVWEMAIKASIGRLSVLTTANLATVVSDQLRQLACGVLPVRLDHALRLASLPPVHRDPFDRMLIAQALLDGLTLVTRDAALGDHGVDCLW
jgi:PIN domain nuclease of toxin-antitoxin system